jgi:Na+-transporting methylmalonyl-CoA/oxaloacetate decarboxylase gamma subunit
VNLDLGVGLGALALVVGFPLLLLLFTLFLGRLEAWMLMPDERAAEVAKLLEQLDETEELERAVAVMMADVTPRTEERRGVDAAVRRRAVTLARRRRAAVERQTARTRS